MEFGCIVLIYLPIFQWLVLDIITFNLGGNDASQISLTSLLTGNPLSGASKQSHKSHGACT